MYFNSKGQEEVTYDAIVIGTGISGGWAAKELCEKGLNTLVLERGRMVRHVVDYPTANLDPWDMPNRGRTSPKEIEEKYPKQSRTGYTVSEATKHWFVNDIENPYSEVKRFDWMRGYHVGGRSIMWGRHSYRLSDLDFTANAKDGHGTDWPIRYAEMAPWYDYVETFAGISGQNEGLHQLPDGKFLPAMPLNCVEQKLRESTAANFNGRVITMSAPANPSAIAATVTTTLACCPAAGRRATSCAVRWTAERWATTVAAVRKSGVSPESAAARLGRKGSRSRLGVRP